MLLKTETLREKTPCNHNTGFTPERKQPRCLLVCLLAWEPPESLLCADSNPVSALFLVVCATDGCCLPPPAILLLFCWVRILCLQTSLLSDCWVRFSRLAGVQVWFLGHPQYRHLPGGRSKVVLTQFVAWGGRGGCHPFPPTLLLPVL